MSKFINVGVYPPHNKSKSALKRAIADGERVGVYATSFYNAPIERDVYLIPEDVVYSVCGPDPEHSRKWYASIERGKDGSVTVK
jgi:hypothetical protein